MENPALGRWKEVPSHDQAPVLRREYTDEVMVLPNEEAVLFSFPMLHNSKATQKLRSSKGNEAHEQGNQLYLCSLSSQISLLRAGEEECLLSSH